MNARNIAKSIARPAAYAIFSTKYEFDKRLIRPFRDINILSIKESLDMIAATGVSVSRFGDGEFNWIFMENSAEFQRGSKELSNRLLEVLQSSKKKHRVTLPAAFCDDQLSTQTLRSRMFWGYYLGRKGKRCRALIDSGIYLNTDISRSYIQYLDLSLAKSAFDSFKDIIAEKNVLIVEGEGTRLGVGNDLISKARSIHRIICPAENAFFHYDEIYQSVKSIIRQYDLVLIALGPTATILAYDLADFNVQTIDIGHIDVEYRWYQMRVTKPTPLEDRYVNECGQSTFSAVHDEEYYNQILLSIAAEGY